AQGKGRALDQHPQKEAEGEKGGQFEAEGQQVFQVGKDDGQFIVVGIDQSQDQGDHKYKNRGDQGQGNHRKHLGKDELLFGKSIDQVLLDGLVAVFIGHHRNDHYGQEQFEKGRNKSVEVPNIGEVEDALFRQVELDGAYIEFDGRDQGDRGQEKKVGYCQYPACPVVPELDEFYL